MLFNSPEFLIFLVIVYFLYRFLRRSAQNLMLIVASYLFYGWWDVRFLFLIAISTAVDFWTGLIIDEGQISLRKRIIVQTYVILAAFFFVTVQWKAVLTPSGLWNIAWDETLSNPLGWLTLLGTVVIALLSNIVYPWLISREEKIRRNSALALSVINNLLILGCFKYFNFFIDSADGILQTLGLNVEFFRLDVILPVGISFYTFQTMSYTIDIYRGKLKSTQHFPEFVLFVSYFPQLVAGPIERASHLLPCILKPRKITFTQSAHGLHLILVGFFKKVAIADGVARVVEQSYSSTGLITSADILLGTVFFAIQIYCDFSGYSDIARGVSNLLGIELIVNFKTPYFSKDPREFWQRWHISLSTWLRDYLYIPLGGNRVSSLQTYRNLMVTMVLGGLWHGAAWNFVLWGAYQGAILCIHRLWTIKTKRGVYETTNYFYNIVAILLFQPFILYGWLLFRANSFQQIADFTGKLLWSPNFSLGLGLPTLSAIAGIPLLIMLDTIEYSHQNREHYHQKLSDPLRGALYAGMIFCIFLGLSNAPAEFIYFDF